MKFAAQKHSGGEKIYITLLGRVFCDDKLLPHSTIEHLFVSPQCSEYSIVLKRGEQICGKYRVYTK